jgi:hypothetical protein
VSTGAVERGGRARVVTALALLPLAYVASFVAFHGVDCPVEDAWELVPYVERMHAGALSASDLWALHNEHRIVFPRALMLLLAWLSGWNTRVEMAASLTLAAVALAVLLRQARASFASLGHAPPAWLALALAALVFSLGQWESWLRGWQVQMFVAWAAALGALALLAGGLGRARLAGAIALAATATLSFGAGVMTWPAGAVVLAAAPAAQRRRPLAAWLGAMALTIGAYAVGYETPGRHLSPVESLTAHPVATLVFFLAFLGSAVDPARNVIVASLAGLLAVLALGGAARRLWRSEARGRLAFWAAVALLVVGTAAMTAVARTVMFGPFGALSSRYMTLSAPLWGAVVVALGLEAAAASARARVARQVAIASVVGLALLTSIRAEPAARNEAQATQESVVALRLDHPDVYPRLCFFLPPQVTRARAMVLRRLQLTAFRPRRGKPG